MPLTDSPANPFAEGSSLRPIFDTLASRDPLPPLVAPGKPWDNTLAQSLQTARQNHAAPDIVIAALHLLNDDLDAAHVLVQNDGSQTGSYLHYLVHRREGDWSNTRYWAARTGSHPIFSTLAQLTGSKNWDARAVVGDMEAAERKGQNSADYRSASEQSAREMIEAVVWCAAQAR